MKSKSVLVIDDKPVILQLLERVLKRKDTMLPSLLMVPRAWPNIQRVGQIWFSRIFMMPGLNGYQVLESIRQDSDVPVVITNGKDDPDSLQKVLTLGADALVQKPFSPLEIVGQIQEKMRLIEARV